MKKKLIFLDGDGTLWYPKATKRTQKPHWVYHDPLTKDSYLEHLELTPRAKETLEVFHQKGVYLVVISANPSAEEIAVREIKKRLEYFGLLHLFHSWHASRASDSSNKAIVMLEVLCSLGLNKEDAIMVGDSYFYDYLPAREVGIDALFVENEVARMPDIVPVDMQRVQDIWELIDILR